MPNRTTFSSIGSVKNRCTYRLEFLANEDGVAKIVEFSAPDVTPALDMIRGDASRRHVEIWVDGKHTCKVRHSSKGIRIVKVGSPK